MQIKVEHPYIVKEKRVSGGSPIIKGTRIPVWAIVGYYKKLNYSIEEILKHLPELSPAQVYDAFSFYYDHQNDVERELELNSNEEYWKGQSLTGEN